MKKELDFSKAKRNPYAKRLKESISIRIDKEALEYFKVIAAKEGVPYQTLMNSFLVDCAKKKREMHVSWD